MKKKLKITLITLLALILLLAGVFWIYVSDYSRADDIAVAALANDQTIRKEGKLTILAPSTPSDTGMIFYPGGKVEATAYLPLLEKLRENGVTCVLVEMPFNLAVFRSNAADQVYEKLPAITNWYIGGHSLGGAMASGYAAKHQDSLKGLILLGAYRYGDVPPAAALTIYGSEDQVLNRSKVNNSENVHVIDGGNHAQFGNYGLQKGDGPASISPEAQQEAAVELILDFIESRNQATKGGIPDEN